MQKGHGLQAGPSGDSPQADNSETVYISSMALLKMLKHGNLSAFPISIAPLQFVGCYWISHSHSHSHSQSHSHSHSCKNRQSRNSLRSDGADAGRVY